MAGETSIIHGALPISATAFSLFAGTSRGLSPRLTFFGMQFIRAVNYFRVIRSSITMRSLPLSSIVKWR